MSVVGMTGVTTDTPKNILFGAGTIHKGLTYTAGTWNFAESIIGATNGGSKLSIVPEITTLELDGALVTMATMTIRMWWTSLMNLFQALRH